VNAPATPAMTTGDLARRLTYQGERTPDGRPIRTWMVRRMFEMGLVAEANTRLGKYRLISESDVPGVLDALRRAGYLPTQETVSPAAPSARP
jgi:hypothetical protein